MTSHERAGCTHDRRCYALVLLATFASPGQGEATALRRCDLDLDAYAQMPEATTSIEVFGTPTETILRMLRQRAGSGIRLNISPHHTGGFTRTPGG